MKRKSRKTLRGVKDCCGDMVFPCCDVSFAAVAAWKDLKVL